jgi:AcrR family transcriptional regulator
MARTVKTVEDRREQIMESALRVFAKKGYAHSSNKDIAREAGITPGLIYHYFESKAALLKAIFEERSPSRISREIPDQILSLPLEQFLRFMIQHMLTGIEDGKFMPMLQIYLSEAANHPEVAPIITSMIAGGSRFMEGYLAAKMESGELRKTDPALVTELVMGSVMNMAMRRKVLHDPLTTKYSQEEIVEGLVSLALNGLSPG